MPEPCLVCHTQPGPVCDDDMSTMDRHLVSLPRRLAAVAAALPSSPAATAERVSISSHVTAGLPGRLDALSLLGPGCDVPATLHPLVRHWSTKRKVLVITHPAGRARLAEVEVTDWFHEAVVDQDGEPVMTLVRDDDQVGSIPPREWLDMQVRKWRAHFGHHVPARTLRRPVRRRPPPAYAWMTLLRVAGGGRLLAFLAATHVVGRAYLQQTHLGILGREEPEVRPLDPVADEVERRWGPPTAPLTMRWDVDYLRTWLPKACAEDALDIASFAAQLGTLHAEIGRVLGETPDRQRVGRCPAFLAELDERGQPTGRKRPCGAGLWRDQFSAQALCPRCRSAWDTCGHAGQGTAREIRRVWPVDRHRRYNATEIDRLTPPKCPSCDNRVKIEWRDVTGTRDRTRTWQPVAASCGNGCDDARRIL